MKRKSFLFLLIFFSAWSLSFAQSGSMTDNQVVSFIMAQREQGVPQSSIIQKLMQKGVTVEQLRRVRKNYQSQQEQFGQVGQVDTKDVTKNRQRVNRQMRESQTQNSNLVEPLNSNGNRVNQQYTREETQDLFSDELTFLDIDSVMYHQNLLKEYNQSQIFGHNIFNNNKIMIMPNDGEFKPIKYVVEGITEYNERNPQQGAIQDNTQDHTIAFCQGVGTVVDELFGEVLLK